MSPPQRLLRSLKFSTTQDTANHGLEVTQGDLSCCLDNLGKKEFQVEPCLLARLGRSCLDELEDVTGATEVRSPLVKLLPVDLSSD